MTGDQHANLARSYDADSYAVDIEGGHAQLCSSRALTHAVLALVAEQRTANLLALLAVAGAPLPGLSEVGAGHLWDDIVTRLPDTAVNR